MIKKTNPHTEFWTKWQYSILQIPYQNSRASLVCLFPVLFPRVVRLSRFSWCNRDDGGTANKRWKSIDVLKNEKQIHLYISSYIYIYNFFFLKKNLLFSRWLALIFFLFSHDFQLSRIKEAALTVIVLAFSIFSIVSFVWR